MPKVLCKVKCITNLRKKKFNCPFGQHFYEADLYSVSAMLSLYPFPSVCGGIASVCSSYTYLILFKFVFSNLSNQLSPVGAHELLYVLSHLNHKKALKT